jgi:hypothetical protein
MKYFFLKTNGALNYFVVSDHGGENAIISSLEAALLLARCGWRWVLSNNFS